MLCFFGVSLQTHCPSLYNYNPISLESSEPSMLSCTHGWRGVDMNCSLLRKFRHSILRWSYKSWTSCPNSIQLPSPLYQIVNPLESLNLTASLEFENFQVVLLLKRICHFSVWRKVSRFLCGVKSVTMDYKKAEILTRSRYNKLPLLDL